MLPIRPARLVPRAAVLAVATAAAAAAAGQSGVPAARADARPWRAPVGGEVVRRVLDPPPGARGRPWRAPVAGELVRRVSDPPPRARGRPWRAPVAGEVVGRFSYSKARPFAAGQRRGIDLAAPPGSVVGAACAGRVSFAGRLPSGARGVSVRCGGLTATHLGLARVAVRRETTVRAGAVLGTVGRAGRVRLGARVTASAFGYVDPLGLLGADRPAPPTAPLGRAPEPRPAAPLGRAPRPAPVAGVRHRVPAPETRLHVPRVGTDASGSFSALRPAAPGTPAAIPPPPVGSPSALRPAASGSPSAIPSAAWAGLVLLAAGLPLAGLTRAARRRRAAPIPSARWFACSPSSRP